MECILSIVLLLVLLLLPVSGLLCPLQGWLGDMELHASSSAISQLVERSTVSVANVGRLVYIVRFIVLRLRLDCAVGIFMHRRDII